MATVAPLEVKVEPAEILTDNVNKTEPKIESATTQKTTNVTTSNDQSSTTEVVSPKTNDNTSANQSRSASYTPRPPPKFDAATEERVRDLLGKARSVANGGDNAFKSEVDIYDLTLLTNNLVQLMNAAYIVSFLWSTALLVLTSAQATDTIVRGVSYMQGESHAQPKTAMSHARQDRCAQKAAAQYPSENSNNGLNTHANDNTLGTNNVNITESTTSTGSNKENTAPDTTDQQQNVKSSEGKNKKKKRYWINRRNHQKRRDNANHKTQEGKIDDQANGVAEVKDDAVDKGAVKEHKPETSGSDTAVEETAQGQGAATAVKV